MSLYASMGIAQGALNVNQIGLNVVSNNIANMNTEGYSKQRAELSNIQGYALVGNGSGKSNYIGAGVQVDKIISYRDFYMDSSFRTNNSANSYYETLFQNAQNISTILNEYNDSGLRTAFANFMMQHRHFQQIQQTLFTEAILQRRHTMLPMFSMNFQQSFKMKEIFLLEISICLETLKILKLHQLSNH